MPKIFTSQKQIIGKLGEDLAKKFLIKHKYLILEENYTKKYGEVDLIVKKEDKIHFIEVKSIVSHETKPNVPRETQNSVTRGTFKEEIYNPLENVHPMKLKRLSRVIQVYLVTHETKDWQFDVITVKINQRDKIGTIQHIKNLII